MGVINMRCDPCIDRTFDCDENKNVGLSIFLRSYSIYSFIKNV